ncbi:MAG: methyltransferase domain-containing protein [Betaproteobacteria bacterium]|nr:methyltransferase domain-containing protein [Betaproteobacteria bacterium]
MNAWWQSPPGQYVLNWQQLQFDRVVGDLFGYHALQVGLPHIDTLRLNRMPHRWMACPNASDLQWWITRLPQGNAAPKPVSVLLAESVALPFADQSLDLVALPNGLETSLDPHATLREVERVLVPEGRLVISGLNPMSLWGLRQQRTQWLKRWGLGAEFVPDMGDWMGYWRLRDWLKLLSFQIERGNFGIYRPAVNQQIWLQRWAWMDKAGERWWPILGAAYFLVAIKRVQGLRLLGAKWRRAAAVAVRQTSTAKTRPVLTRRQVDEVVDEMR